MRYTYALSALRDKRARLAGEIISTKRTLGRLHKNLRAIDATLRLFHPAADPSHITPIRPCRPQTYGFYFRRSERPRLAMEALRDAGKPLSTPVITEYVMRAKGMDRDDKELRDTIREFMYSALARLAARGVVRKIIEAPDVWWESVV
jgi:hypothetical protein